MTVAQKDNLILDNGGTRSGLSRRTTTDRRYSNNYWDGSRIERRDAFRK